MKTQKKQLYSPHPLIEKCIPQFSTAFENCIPHGTLPRRYNQPEALSIQQKIPVSSNFRNFRFPERNGRLRAKSRYRAFGYRTCKRDTEERYWVQRFGKWKGTHLDRSNWTIFKGGPKYSGRTEPKWSVPFETRLISNRNFRNFGLNEKHPTVPCNDLWSHVTG